MHWFLKTFIVPMLKALRPAVIVEVGVELGTVTKPLLEWARENGALLHSIDPNPKLEVADLAQELTEHMRFHRAPSLEVLPIIEGVDLALIDGDHNWYTVINELRQLQERADNDERQPPVILLHDIGWPYGRRDLYYNPAAIPAAHRQAHAQLGIVPGRVELMRQGINGHLENAQLEGTPANGVLTAVEDFITESHHAWRFHSIPGLSGLGVLLTAETYAQSEAMRTLLERIEEPDFLRAQCEAIESARLDAEVRRARLARKLAETELKLRAADPNELPFVEDRAFVLKEQLRIVAEFEEQLQEQLDARSAAAEHRHLRDIDTALSERSDLAYARAQSFHAHTPGIPAWERELELRGQEAFLDAYLVELAGKESGHGGRNPLSTTESGNDERDPLSLPSTNDRHGLLCATAETQQAGEPNVDVVVCVHDALEDVRRCLCALLESTERRFRLILVNDGSDRHTSDFLADLAAAHPAVTLIHRAEPPHGYTLAANAGLRASQSDYVVLLNSDTVPTPGWLTRIIDYGERHPRVGILGPLSNAASHQSVPTLRDEGAWAVNPLPDWLTEDGMALIVERGAPRVEARLPFINGFCYTIKREVIEAIGYFDEEHFASGYCEENDYSHRAFKRGYELAVVDDAYVHHAKSRSFGAARKELAKRHYQTFLDKHERGEIEQLVQGMEADTTLTPVREAVARYSSDPTTFATLLSNDRPPLEVHFILPGLAEGGSGGSHSIYQEVKGMRALGIPARIALHASAGERARRAYEDADEIFREFADLDELARVTATADVISATHFKSFALLSELGRRREDFLPAYYVQDYEPFFTAPGSDDLAEALASYTALPDMLLFAKTHWLCNVVGARHGVPVHRVQPSIDERLFVPEGAEREDELVRVVAMIRPRTPRRQPFSTVALLERLLAEFPEQIKVSTFGCQHLELSRLTRSRAIIDGHRGVLSRAAVAQELRHSDIFLDMSMYQAFGRSALEAMACGCTAIVPEIGGAWEFVEHGINALAVNTLDPDAAFQAAASLVADRIQLESMQSQARKTASHFSIARAALSEYLLFERHHRQRFESATVERSAALQPLQPVATACP